MSGFVVAGAESTAALAPDLDVALIEDPSPPSAMSAGRIVTMLLVAGPVVALALLLPFGWGRVVNTGDVVTATVFYVLTGFGIAVGFHRYFTHRSFKANRILKIVLAVAGSMALEGALISWVAIHRRHHMFGDKPGDPHSPHRFDAQTSGILRGFVWAHVGWLLADSPTDVGRYAPDLRRDPDLVLIDRLFPVFAVASLVLPFVIGWFLYGTLAGALGVFLWAGLLRMALLHHVTWSINSVCHIWGKRPFITNDLSTNFAPLALLSFGESWHNFHHSSPSSARHGALPGQVDAAARIIRLFEKAGWATKVRWPSLDQINALTITHPLPGDLMPGEHDDGTALSPTLK